MTEPTIVAIDPGIRGTGLAIWPMKDWRKETMPIATYVLNAPADDDWIYATLHIREQIVEIVEKHNICKAYCEFPQYFQSGVGHAASAKGDILKLAYFVGVVSGIFAGNSTMLTPVFVNVWKGQLSKDAVIARLLKREPRLADLNIQSHAWDAVGIGFYAKGIFHHKK